MAGLDGAFLACGASQACCCKGAITCQVNIGMGTATSGQATIMAAMSLARVPWRTGVRRHSHMPG